MRILCLILCLIFVPALNPAAAQANSGEMPQEQQLAVKYMNALTEHDYKTLRKFYNRESVFFDKTANRKYTGGRFIIDFLERAHEGVLEYDFNIEHMYNAGSLVVMIGNYHFKGPVNNSANLAKSSTLPFLASRVLNSICSTIG